LGLRVLGTTIGDRDKPDAQIVSDGITAALRNIQQVGKAGIGDKTLVDLLAPASDALSAAVAGGQGLTAAFRAAAEVADKAAQSTADLLPKVGRARPLAEKSVGTADAGAVSMALAFCAVSRVLDRTK
jgi:dihydroxyacetone kinase